MVASANRRKAAMDARPKIGACVAAMNQAEENRGSGGARGKEQVGSDDDFQPTTPKKPRLFLCPVSDGDRFIEGDGDELDLDSEQSLPEHDESLQEDPKREDSEMADRWAELYSQMAQHMKMFTPVQSSADLLCLVLETPDTEQEQTVLSNMNRRYECDWMETTLSAAGSSFLERIVSLRERQSERERERERERESE